eukprot:4703840-Pyramimonas_sp.AAC.1
MTCTVETPREQQHARIARQTLRDHGLRLLYAERFLDILEDFPTMPETVEHLWEQGVQAAQFVTAVVSAEKKKPWISKHIVDLIDKGSRAREANITQEEKRLLKQMRRSCKHDSASWTVRRIANGTWDAMRAHC